MVLFSRNLFLTYSESEIKTLELLKSENLLIIGNEEDNFAAEENSEVFPRLELSRYNNVDI